MQHVCSSHWNLKSLLIANWINVFLYFLRKYDLYFYIHILNLNARLSLKSFKPFVYSLLILLPSSLIYAFVKLGLWDSIIYSLFNSYLFNSDIQNTIYDLSSRVFRYRLLNYFMCKLIISPIFWSTCNSDLQITTQTSICSVWHCCWGSRLLKADVASAWMKRSDCYLRRGNKHVPQLAPSQHTHTA